MATKATKINTQNQLAVNHAMTCLASMYGLRLPWRTLTEETWNPHCHEQQSVVLLVLMRGFVGLRQLFRLLRLSCLLCLLRPLASLWLLRVVGLSGA